MLLPLLVVIRFPPLDTTSPEPSPKTMTEHAPATAEWYTPADLLDRVKRVHTIDIDPCSNSVANEAVGALHYLTKETDALTQPWYVPTLIEADCFAFINPPSGRVGRSTLPTLFYQKAVEELDKGHLKAFVFVCFNISQLQPLARLELPREGATICIPSSRVAFWQPGRLKSSPERSNAIVFESACPLLTQKFRDAFCDYGKLLSA